MLEVKHAVWLYHRLATSVPFRATYWYRRRSVSVDL